MAISTRNKILVSKGGNITNYVLVEFSSFLSETWGRLCVGGDVDIVDSGTTYTYYDYFSSSFPSINRELDFFNGGLKPVSNLTFKLSNADNLIKTIGSNVLEHTNVNIYVLMDAGGTLDKSNAELRFSGRVPTDGVKYDDSDISITIVDIVEFNNRDILTTKLTKDDYPNIESSAEGKYLPMVGGPWHDNANIGWPTYVREKGLDCATPAYCVDEQTNKFMFADHPIKTTADEMMPENTFDELTDVRRPIGNIFVHEDNSDSFFWIYNGSTDTDDDSYLNSFTIPENTKVMAGAVKPIGTSESYSVNLSNNINDGNKIVETGRDCKTLFQVGSIWDAGYLWLKFPELNFNFDHVSMGLYLELIGAESAWSSNSGKWSMVTDGNGYVHKVDLSWLKENSTRTEYFIRRYDAETYGNNDSDFIFTLSDDDRLIRTTNIGKEWIGDNEDAGQTYNYGVFTQRLTRRLESDGSLGEVHPPPPMNVDSILNNGSYDDDIDRIVYTSVYPNTWSAVLFNNDRAKIWKLGLRGTRLRVENIYLHYVDLYYEGGLFNPFPKKPKLGDENFRIKVLGTTVWTKNKKENLRKLEKYQREIDKYYDRIDEVEDLSNVHPVFCMINGYTLDNTPSSVGMVTPVNHVTYAVLHRMGLTLGTDTDSSSFATTAGVRDSSDSSSYGDKWKNHICVTTQKQVHDWLRQLADENNLIVYPWNGKYYLQDRDLWSSYAGRWASVCEFDESDIYEWSFKKQKELYDSFTLNYAFDYAKGDYRRQLRMSPTEANDNWYEAADSVFDNIRADGDVSTYNIDGYTESSLRAILTNVHDNYFNKTSNDDLNELVVNLDTVQSTDTARRIMIALIKLYSTQRSIVTFTCGKKGLLLKLGDVISLQHTDFQDTGNYLVTGISENPVELEFEIEAIKVE